MTINELIGRLQLLKTQVSRDAGIAVSGRTAKDRSYRSIRWRWKAALDPTLRSTARRREPVWNHPKIVVTPHEAGGTPQGSLAHLAENYKRLLDGRTLINIADPARGY